MVTSSKTSKLKRKTKAFTRPGKVSKGVHRQLEDFFAIAGELYDEFHERHLESIKQYWNYKSVATYVPLELEPELTKPIIAEIKKINKSRSKENREDEFWYTPPPRNTYDDYTDLTTIKTTERFKILKDYDVSATRSVVKRVGDAFARYIDRASGNIKVGLPRKKGRDGRIHSFTVDYRLAKNKSMLFRKSKRWQINIKGFDPIYVKELPCERKDIKQIRIVKTPVRVNVQLIYEHDATTHIDESPILGVDVGVKTRAHLSDNRTICKTKIKNKRRKRLQRKLRLASKRGRKGEVRNHHKPMTLRSNNYNKAKHSHAKECFKIAEREKHKCHRITRAIVNSNPNIAMEDINVRKITHKGKTNKNRKKPLNRNILGQSWGQLRYQLTYKAEDAGGKVVVVSARNTSRTCSRCGSVKKTLSLRERVYSCSGCGIQIDRDLNAAINIACRGKEALDQSGLSVPICDEPRRARLGGILERLPTDDLSSAGKCIQSAQNRSPVFDITDGNSQLSQEIQ